MKRTICFVLTCRFRYHNETKIDISRRQCPFKGHNKVLAVLSMKSCLIDTSLIRAQFAKKIQTWLATIIGNSPNFTNILFRHLNNFLCLQSVKKVYISLLPSHNPYRDIECEPLTKNHPLVDCYMIGLFNPIIDRMFNPLD